MSEWAVSKIDDDHLCGFLSGRRLELSLTDCGWSMGERSLEEPARGSWEVGTSDGMLAWLDGMVRAPPLLGDDGRLLRG